jgi:hypothetical protein
MGDLGASYMRFPMHASAIYPDTDASDGAYTGFYYLQKTRRSIDLHLH